MELKDVVKGLRESEQPAPVLCAYGSSNTEQHWHSAGRWNWVSWLSSALKEWVRRDITTINAGLGGDTADGLIERFEAYVTPFKPKAVIITIGGNDASRKDDIPFYKDNILKTIELVKGSGANAVLQTYFCPQYKELQGNMHIFEKYVEANRELAKECDCALIEQYAYFAPLYENAPEKYEKFMVDPLHVSYIGNAIMGILACRQLGLYDPPLPEDSVKEIRTALKEMSEYVKLPPRLFPD